jgi:hypothetical protein
VRRPYNSVIAMARAAAFRDAADEIERQGGMAVDSDDGRRSWVARGASAARIDMVRMLRQMADAEEARG